MSKDFMEFDAYCFDKIDGSNLRFQWTKKMVGINLAPEEDYLMRQI